MGQAPARQAALRGGLPASVSALTINKVCGSGLKAIQLAANAVRLGDHEVVLAGGMESMSNAPYLMPKLRAGARMGHTEAKDAMILDGHWCAMTDQHMGHTGELVAAKYGVGREAQDAWAAESHRKAVAAIRSGAFQAEIVPIAVPGRKGDVLLAISTSGNSPNVIAAVRQARKQGLVTVGFSGGDGGPLLREWDHCVVVPATGAARVQEMHLIAGHVICDIVEQDVVHPTHETK